MRFSPRGARLIRHLVTGGEPNGELQGVEGPVRRLAEKMATLPVGDRTTALECFAAAFDDGGELVRDLAGVDLNEPLPAEPGSATLADIRRLVADGRWLWPGWLAAAVLNGLAADPGTGKTILAFWLAIVLWFKKPWPDDEPNALPERTRTLWVPGDRHYGQLLGLAKAFGLPDEALIFNAPVTNPTAGLDLDDPAELSALENRIRAEEPGLVVVDTVGMTTARNLCKPEDARSYFGRLMDIARETGVAFLLLTHLSRDGQALGRRISGACRLVWKLTDPDPEAQPSRRRLWVDKTFVEKPKALRMTISEKVCEFDDKPPTAPAPLSVGRPSKERDEAIKFLTDKLSEKDRKQCELIKEWEDSGKQKGTLFNAIKDMQDDERLVIDDSTKPKVCHLIKKHNNDQESDS